MRFLAIVLVSMITSSCAMEVKNSDLIGQCMMLKDSVSIWHAYDNLYVGKFLLAKNSLLDYFEVQNHSEILRLIQKLN